jgi:hypothetical protein
VAGRRFLINSLRCGGLFLTDKPPFFFRLDYHFAFGLQIGGTQVALQMSPK